LRATAMTLADRSTDRQIHSIHFHTLPLTSM